MKNIISSTSKNCVSCSMNINPKKITIAGSARSAGRELLPGEEIQADIAYLPVTKFNKNKFAVVLCDTVTHHVSAVELPSITAKNTAKALLRYFAVTGLPRHVKVDMGPEWGYHFQHTLAKLGVNVVTTIPRRSNSIAGAEKAIDLLKRALNRAVNQYIPSMRCQWEEILPRVINSINTSTLRQTTLSRRQLYHSPLIYQNNLASPPLDLADVADIHCRTLAELTRLRDLNIKRKAKNAFSDLTEGTIVVHVLGDKEVPTQQDGTRGLVPTAQDVYKITSFTSGMIGANVVSLVTGDERTLPVSSLRRLMLEDSLGIDIDPNILFSDIKTARHNQRYRSRKTGPHFLKEPKEINQQKNPDSDNSEKLVNNINQDLKTKSILKKPDCQFTSETETFVKKEIDRLKLSEWKAFIEAKRLTQHLSTPLTRPQILCKNEEFDFASLARYSLPPITDPSLPWPGSEPETDQEYRETNKAGKEDAKVTFVSNPPTLYPQKRVKVNNINAFTPAGVVIRLENDISIKEFSSLNAFKIR